MAGDSVGLTTDVPRGTRMRAQDGIISIARLSNVPIIPICYSSNNSKISDVLKAGFDICLQTTPTTSLLLNETFTLDPT